MELFILFLLLFAVAVIVGYLLSLIPGIPGIVVTAAQIAAAVVFAVGVGRL
jgi:hypothetical protein